MYVTTPENSRIVKYSIDSKYGVLSVYSLNPKSDAQKEKFTTGNGLSTALVEVNFRAVEYQSLLASLIAGSHSINIIYKNPIKAIQKPNRFEVESKKLLTFN